MSLSLYTITVPATTALDAADIAKRRAREDGWRIRTVNRIRPQDQEQTRWTVELAVVR